MGYTSRSVDLTPDDDPRISTRLANLGTAYSLRFKLIGELDDLQSSVQYQSQAVASTPDGHPDMPSFLASLAVSHGDRFKRIGDLDDIDKAIEYGSRALALAPTGHPLLSSWHANLGVSHTIRSERLGEIGDLERAIECQTRALDLTPDNHPHLPHMLGTLGMSHRNRYKRLSRQDDLEKAIEYQSRGIGLTPDGHPMLPARLGNLALSHTTRFARLHDPEDLEKALGYKTRALALTPNGHPDMSSHLNNLGATYGDRFQHFGDLDDLKTAVDYFSKALTLIPNDHPDLCPQNQTLGRHYFFLYLRTGDPSYSGNALVCFRSATQSVTGHPRAKFEAALVWTRSASLQNSLNPLEAYQTAINLLPQFIWLGASTNQRYQDLRTAESLAVNAAYAAITYSEYPLALEWLEHARCVVWSQSLMLRSPLDQLRSSQPDLAERLDTVSSRLHSVSSERLESRRVDAEQIAQEHHRLAKEYNQLLNEARSLAGFEDFLRPMKAAGLARAAKHGPMVVINCHKDQCDALVVLPDIEKVQHIPLPDFSHDMAQYVWTEMRRTLSQRGYRERRPVGPCQPRHACCLDNGLRLIWYGIVKPVLDFLHYTPTTSTNDLPHITWCPTGPVSFLPLHAAGDYSQPNARVFDYVVSSYTPTLTALLSSSPCSLSPDSEIFAVGLQHTLGHSSLPGTVTELASIDRHTKDKVGHKKLVNEEATTEAVLDGMEHSQWVHLSCHAHQSVSDPTKSGFFLHGGTLDIDAINRRSFKNKGLAFLSACQTAKGDQNLPDEAVHLASGMLMAGYPSVIGTMWSVRDDDAPLIADKVYEQLMKEGKVGNGEAGRALHYAVGELRKAIGEDKYERWMPYIHIGS